MIFPMPFVKAGIISAYHFLETSHVSYVDGHNNKGFSGGPLVFLPNGLPSNEFRVAGVVANYPTPIIEPVVNSDRKPILGVDDQPIAYFQENQGFVVAFSIRHATDLIDANPTGFPLSTEQEK